MGYRRPLATVRFADIGYGAVGNGSVPGTYWWTESDENVDLRVLVPPCSESRDVGFALSPGRLKLDVRGSTVLAGRLRGRVYTDGSYWCA